MTESNREKFVIEEFKQCWSYIALHYQQREAGRRLYFTLLSGSVAIVAALVRTDPSSILRENASFLLLLAPVSLLGLLLCIEMGYLRNTTSLFHREIVRIRAKEIHDPATFLWTDPAKVRPLNIAGFNFVALLGVALANTLAFAAAVSGASALVTGSTPGLWCLLGWSLLWLVLEVGGYSMALATGRRRAA